MAARTVLLIVLGLAAGTLSAVLDRAAPLVESPQEHDIDKDPPLLEPMRNLDSAVPSTETNHNPEDFKSECDAICKICNATGEVRNGACLCFSDNGGEVVCLHMQRQVAQEVGLPLSPVPDELLGEIDEDTKRSERCLGMVSSTRGALQSILGQGFGNMTLTERAALFRKRIESLRRRTNLEAKPPTGAALLPPLVPVVQPLQPSPFGLPVSPILGAPASSQPTSGSITAGSGGILGAPNPASPVNPGPVTAGNQPALNLGLPTGRSLNNMMPSGDLRLGAAIPQLPATYPSQQGNTENAGIVGNVPEAGRVLRSSISSSLNPDSALSHDHADENPIVSRAAVPNPIAAEAGESQSSKSNSNDQGEMIPAVVINIPKQAFLAEAPKNQNINGKAQEPTGKSQDKDNNSKASQFRPTEMGHQIYEVINGDFKSVDGLIKSVGGEGFGTLMGSFMSHPQS